ncbi:biotin-dependent carboxyltransferase family protein [Amycolatopsis rhizosphaerae]|uniref:Biotin-dependent carboxyltransferase family protein n=1 Tax=Amycolatopsis rhizosphaerae TaxID=2053003 RepID=A0A558CVK4_9PSEU|nr:biotin-dependent carboxyltransferase family protein [Amycolatopsis rhizosphaerae]TVT52807.1 biotin-dependent carboxyltransferase family protein [Amycolatopsis rhizosphaerae]
MPESWSSEKCVPGLTILQPGPLATVQDLGRPGFAGIGLPRSGAADRGSLRFANRLLGNEEDTAGVEVTGGGFSARACGDLTIAVTGAPCPVTIDGTVRTMNSPLDLPAGSTLCLGPPEAGIRTYLAVAGGISTPPVLGSRATDLLSDLGPGPLRSGTELTVGPPSTAPPPRLSTPLAVPDTGTLTLRVIPGPRHEWFEETALKTLLNEPYTVTSEISRIGIRLDGTALPRVERGEMRGEGMVPGALQVPPSGRPTLFLADHPVISAYPVIAVVVSSDVDAAAQARPGQKLRFALMTPERDIRTSVH